MKHECEACQRPLPEHTPRSCLYQVVVILGLLLAVLALAGVGTLRSTVTHLQQLSTHENTPVANETTPEPELHKACDFPVVYNKPHKTASTRIQIDVFKWAKSLGRPAYKCSAYINQATLQMRECIPDDRSGCAVIATHVVMSPLMTDILERKIGKFFLVTSTRNPRDRLLSLYLQVRQTKASAVAGNLTDLKAWLRAENPWSMYNYHTGDNRIGACPMTKEEKLLIPDAVNKADVVVDADLYNASQAILRSKGLFSLSDAKTNVRSSKDLVLDAEAEGLITNVSCVEEEMHRMYRLRMASMYQKATGKKCLSDSRHPTPCF